MVGFVSRLPALRPTPSRASSVFPVGSGNERGGMGVPSSAGVAGRPSLRGDRPVRPSSVVAPQWSNPSTLAAGWGGRQAGREQMNSQWGGKVLQGPQHSTSLPVTPGVPPVQLEGQRQALRVNQATRGQGSGPSPQAVHQQQRGELVALVASVVRGNRQDSRSLGIQERPLCSWAAILQSAGLQEYERPQLWALCRPLLCTTECPGFTSLQRPSEASLPPRRLPYTSAPLERGSVPPAVACPRPSHLAELSV
ncbi:hypothetical protein NDU88_001615 [Pleurodeles waltl]|uniref:Uncharacterized protein n=1 Tax=Pleurodeles waltl TaxID=8319 RepID=A0AAV7W0H7_PLEWA|nr:hypothetical protein NDU88_001615 [Pleurodeles waltl]